MKSIVFQQWDDTGGGFQFYCYLIAEAENRVPSTFDPAAEAWRWARDLMKRYPLRYRIKEVNID